MKKPGFTLVELLVVIGILGVLMAALLGAFGGTTESARATKCRSNMRSLAQACITKAMADGRKRYPHAGSCEYFDTDSRGVTYGEHRGWISWLSRGKYNGDDGMVSSHQTCEQAGIFSSRDDVMFAFSNGVLWTAVGCNESVYKCPTMCIANKNPRDKSDMAWSYAMSARFSYDSTFGQRAIEGPNSGTRIGSISRPDKTLMFAEINMDDLGGGGNGDWHADCVLEYGASSSRHREQIGFPHKTKRGMIGHVAFADAHVEQFTKPKYGDAKELTELLCRGTNVVFKSGVYVAEDQVAR